MSKYRNIHKKIWSDKDFKKSSKDQKLLFFYFSTCESTNNSGIYEIPLSTISEQTSIPQSIVRKILESQSIKNIHYDMENEIVFVVNARKYSPGGNPVQVEKGILNEFKESSKTPLWNLFLDKNPQFKQSFNGCPTVAQPLTNGSLPLPIPLPSEDLTNNIPSPTIKDNFEEDWNLYPRKAGNKIKARVCYHKSVGKDPEKRKQFLEKMQDYVLNTDAEYLKHGETFFRNWQDLVVDTFKSRKNGNKDPAPYIPPPEPVERVRGDPKLEKLWDDSLEKIKAEIGPEDHKLWFGGTYPKNLEDGLLIVAVPNQFTRKAMFENYRGIIENCLKEISGKPILVDFCIDRSQDN